MYYQISLEGYQVICVRSFPFAKGQQAFDSVNQSIYSQDHPKRTSADMELRNYPIPLRVPLKTSVTLFVVLQLYWNFEVHFHLSCWSTENGEGICMVNFPRFTALLFSEQHGVTAYDISEDTGKFNNWAGICISIKSAMLIYAKWYLL